MYYFSKQSYNKNKTISQENLTNLVAVAVGLTIVLGTSLQDKLQEKLYRITLA